MNIGAWNDQGFFNVISSLEQQVDIAFLSETKRKDQGNKDINNYVHFLSGVNRGKRAKAWISILIRKQLMKQVTDYEYIYIGENYEN